MTASYNPSPSPMECFHPWITNLARARHSKANRIHCPTIRMQKLLYWWTSGAVPEYMRIPECRWSRQRVLIQYHQPRPRFPHEDMQAGLRRWSAAPVAVSRVCGEATSASAETHHQTPRRDRCPRRTPPRGPQPHPGSARRSLPPPPGQELLERYRRSAPRHRKFPRCH